MQRTNIIELKPSKKQKKILKECMLLSSCVYNMANYEVRQAFFNKDKVPGFFNLQQKLQNKDDYRLLGRCYALPRIQVYAETNSARFKLIKSRTQKRVGLPKYYKNRYTETTIPSYLVMDNCRYSVKKDHTFIPLSKQMRKRYNIKKHFKIKYSGVLKWKGLQKRGQIHYKDGKFYLHQPVELKEPKNVKSKVFAGVDFGIKKLLAIRTNIGQDKIIGSKRHFKQWLFWTNLIAKEQKKLAKINKKTSKNLQRLFRKRAKWQNNLYNNLVAKLFRFLNRYNISHLSVGDITNIREDNDWGRNGNKMLHNYWAFDKLLQKVVNKSEEYGITKDPQTEEYSSGTCPVCFDYDSRNKKDRIFICHFCGYVDHRDLVGAGNHLYKSMYGSIESIHWGETAPLKVAL